MPVCNRAGNSIRHWYSVAEGRRLTSTLFPYTTLFRSSVPSLRRHRCASDRRAPRRLPQLRPDVPKLWQTPRSRSEEHTSELQSHVKFVCRHLLEKKKITKVRKKVITPDHITTSMK